MNEHSKELMHYAIGEKVPGAKYIDRVKTSKGTWRYIYTRPKTSATATNTKPTNTKPTNAKPSLRDVLMSKGTSKPYHSTPHILEDSNKDKVLGVSMAEVADVRRSIKDGLATRDFWIYDLDDFSSKRYLTESNPERLDDYFYDAIATACGAYGSSSWGEKMASSYKNQQEYFNEAKKLSARVYDDIMAIYKDNKQATQLFSRPEYKKKLLQYVGEEMGYIYENQEDFLGKEEMPRYQKFGDSGRKKTKTVNTQYPNLPGYAKDAIAKSSGQELGKASSTYGLYRKGQGLGSKKPYK